MKNNLFALGYTPHRLWGNLFIPYLIHQQKKEEFYSLEEVVIKDEKTRSYQRLTPMQRKIVDTVDEYNDKILHKLFSKRKTVKEFHDHVDQDTITKFIRPYIEKRLFGIYELASKHNIRVFLKLNVSQNVFDEDFLKLEKIPAKPHFHFKKGKEGTCYHLSVVHKGKEIGFREHHCELISNDPALVLVENQVISVDEIEGKRMLPFFEREHVNIPRSAEQKYYSSFVTNTLKAYDHIDAEGFSVEHIKPDKSVVLSIESGLQNEPGLLMRFNYEKYSVFPASKQIRFVDLKTEDDNFYFRRFERDLEWEQAFAEALDELGLKSHDGNHFTLSNKLDGDLLSNQYELINFINEHIDSLIENGFIIEQKLDHDYYIGEVNLVVNSHEKEDWFDLFIVIKIADAEIPFIQLREHILNNERTFKLPDGKYMVIPQEWFARYKPVFEFGKQENGHVLVHKQHFSQIDKAISSKHAGTIKNLEKLNGIDNLPDIPAPVGLNAILRFYQMEGYSWLWLLQENGFGGCLADDMGLGKTLQALALLERNKELIDHGNQDENTVQTNPQLSLFSSNSNSPLSLIVVPSSLIQNWHNEIQQFLPDFKVLIHVGISRSRNVQEFSNYDVVISSYHTVRQDIEFLRDYQFHYVILDESQMIKNPHSKLYKAMLELSSKHKLVLTGTPIENSLTDLWAQINFVNEGLLGTLSFFKKQFVYNIEKKKNKKQEARLKELINPFILRRTKEEVAKELPPVYEQYRYCSMTDEQKTMYEEEKSTMRNILLDNFEEIGMNTSALMVLKALTKLRQLSNHPGMVDDEYAFGSGKYDEVFRNIESVVSEGHKVLIFSSVVKHIDIYAKQLDQIGWKYSRLTGSTSNRHEQVSAFQEDPDCRIFLISLKAGGVGLNLTAADYVFILDPWWNPAAEMQALSRAHRIGQDKSVFVYRFISNHTVEEKIVRLQKRKSELAKAFVTSNNPLRNMKKEEVMDLFT